MSYVIVGVVCFWLGVGATYLATHAEFRGALFGRLHSTADDIGAKIKAKFDKNEPKP